MSKIQDLKNRGCVPFDVDYRKNTLNDAENGHTGTAGSGSVWKNTSRGRGVHFPLSSANPGISYADAASLQVTEGAILAFSDGIKATKVGNQRIVAKRDAGGTNYDFFIRTVGSYQIEFFDGTTESWGVKSILDAKMVGVKFQNGQKPRFFKDGAFLELGSAVLNNITADNAPLKIGDLYLANYALGSTITRVIIINDYDAVTDEVVSQIYDEVMNERGALRDDPTGWIWNNPLIYPDFERDSQWTKGTGWTIANSKASSDGSQADVSNLSQAVLQVGRQYTVEYRVSGRTAGTVKPLCGTTEGTAVSADGVYSEILTCAGNTNFIIQADADFIGNIEFVNLQEGIYSTYINNLSTVYPTLANVTAGEIGNSGFKVSTGTWKVSEEAIGSQSKKWIENVSAGVAYAPQKKAYGTWVFEMYKALDGSQTYVQFINDTIGIISATGQDGYAIVLASDESVRLQRAIGGTVTNACLTAAGYIAIQQPYLIAVTRSFNNTFTVYIKGGAYTKWTLVSTAGGYGTNPVVDSSTLTSVYNCIDLDAGDKVRMLGIHQGVLGIGELSAIYR